MTKAGTERLALGIYVAMSRDWGAAVEMINECSNVEVLRLLEEILLHPPGAVTDAELNGLFASIVNKAVARLSGPG